MSYPYLPVPELDSYGDIDGVAAYVGVYTDDGDFTDDTTPSYQRVVKWIDQVSDMFNVALADAGFRTPVEQVDARAAIASMVEQLVSDLCHAANTKGRFFTKAAQDRGTNVLGTIWGEIVGWVSDHAIGFTNLGVPRVTGTLGKIGSKGMDASGEKLVPMFQRKEFGNIVKDWTGYD